MRAIDILMIEDRQADIDLTKSVLGAEKVNLRFFTVRDAEQALLFLRQEGIYQLMPPPDLVLLDWKMPTFEAGEHLLVAIRQIAALKRLAVVVMSAYLDDPVAVKRFLDNGATCCIEKPLTLAKFVSIVHAVPEFWITVVRGQY